VTEHAPVRSALALRLATGPVSWGVDFAGAPGNPPWHRVLDGIAAAGFEWLELGPLGFLPADPAAPLAARGLKLSGGFVFEPLHDPARREAVLEVAGRTAATVAAAGGTYLVVIDMVDPVRAATAGRSAVAPRLSPAARRELWAGVDAVAAIATGHGLRPLLHPHAGTHVEFLDEIEPLAERIDLCLDTGHLAYAGLAAAELYERWPDRVGCVHLKDFDPRFAGEDYWSTVRRGAFRPLGAGTVDFDRLFAALAAHGFDGWATIEQDRAPGGSPVADLVTSRRYVEERL
jgi:inosose dehydratase